MFLLFERQARRLDALAAHGEPVDAQVTGVSRDDTITYYAYRVNGNEYTWDVARTDAPFSVGQVFQVIYLPEDPSLSRPFADRRLAAREAAGNRSFSLKVCSGVAFFLLVLAGLAQRDLRRLRSGAPSEIEDPHAYKRRLQFTALAFLSLFLLIGWFHTKDALEKGDSVVPELISLAFVAGILGCGFYLVARDGPLKARERAARMMRWIAPIVFGIALLRLAPFLLLGR
jgi:hypothetical protein